jgi:transcriptional regulator with XRE-family HTH domain
MSRSATQVKLIAPASGVSQRKRMAVVGEIDEENRRMTKKAPNPIDKHVGSRVRMRRMMLGMSQEKLGDALALTFQQVQKYEKGTNRIGASRLQQISQILQVPVAFFFEGAPQLSEGVVTDALQTAPSPSYVSDFLATSDGLSLTKAFMRIPDPKLRRRIVDLVQQIAGEDTESQ